VKDELLVVAYNLARALFLYSTTINRIFRVAIGRCVGPTNSEGVLLLQHFGPSKAR